MLAAFLLAGPLFSSHSYRDRFPLPDATVGSGWGVAIKGTHLEQGELDQIAAAGFKWVRVDFDWSEIESKKGIYDFSAYDELLHSLRSHHLRALVVLHERNPLYENLDPDFGEFQHSVEHFAGAAAKHFSHIGVVWQACDEPNVGKWKNKPDTMEYRFVAGSMAYGISEASKDEWITGLGTHGFDKTFVYVFISACFGQGLLTIFDGISVNPACAEVPESVASDWDGMFRVVGDWTPDRRGTALISSAWGYPSTPGRMTEDQQANLAVRSYFANLASHVNLSIYYDWRDEGNSPTDPEGHFGVVHRDRSPKAAYRLIQSINRDLAGFTYAYRINENDPNINLLAFVKGQQVKVYGWLQQGESKTVVVEQGGQAITLTQRPTLVHIANPLPN